MTELDYSATDLDYSAIIVPTEYEMYPVMYQWTDATSHILDREVSELRHAYRAAEKVEDETTMRYLLEELENDYGVKPTRGGWIMPQCPLCGSWMGNRCGH